MAVHDDEVLDEIKQRAKSGEYDRRSKRKRRQRFKTCRLLMSMQSITLKKWQNVTQSSTEEKNNLYAKKKEKVKKEKMKKKSNHDLYESDDDEILHLKSKYVQSPKHMGNKQLKRLEVAEKKRFIVEDESGSNDADSHNKLSARASNDFQLLQGGEICQ